MNPQHNYPTKDYVSRRLYAICLLSYSLPWRGTESQARSQRRGCCAYRGAAHLAERYKQVVVTAGIVHLHFPNTENSYSFQPIISK